MLYDRPYMRDPRGGERTSPLTWLICAIAAGFLLQMVLLRLFQAGSALGDAFALTVPGLRAGHYWTLVTYGFYHGPSDALHVSSSLLYVVCNGIVLFFLGRELMPMLGGRRFLGLYGAALVLGGLWWAGTHWRHGGQLQLFGATPAVDALLVVFAFFFPNQEITLLLFFVLPVRLKPKYIAWSVFLFDLFFYVFSEILPTGSGMTSIDFAPSAHLGGMLAGLIYYRFVHDSDWRILSRRGDIELPRWLKRSPRADAAPAQAFRVNLGNPADLRAEVDRILDKINSQGFGALTSDEKRVLDEARDLLSKR